MAHNSAPLSFVAAQSQAIKFWSRNPDDGMVLRVFFLVEDGRGGTQHIGFARDVDDYVIRHSDVA